MVVENPSVAMVLAKDFALIVALLCALGVLWQFMTGKMPAVDALAVL